MADAGSVFIRGLVPRYTLNSREHWSARARMVKKQRATVRLWLWAHDPPKLPVTITITRCAPNRLDSDNHVGAQKSVRDEVAVWLGEDDGSERITWVYEQRKAKKGEAGVEIKWEAGGPE